MIHRYFSKLGIVPLILLIHSLSVLCLTQCSTLEGGGVCPEKSTCCKIYDPSGKIGSGCIPHNNHVKEPGQCCSDSPSACVGGYKCDASFSIETGEVDFYCSRIEDGKLLRQPRYQLIEAPAKSIKTMYGFPVHQKDNLEDFNSYGNYVAYYSNKGPILTSSPDDATDSLIRVVVVIVHGSGRNADDYLYAGLVTSSIQNAYPSESVAVIAPRFLAVSDGIMDVPVPAFKNQLNPKRVKPMFWNESYPIAHTWRYGANAVFPSENISSYDAMDSIVEYFIDEKRFHNVERIVVAGHSAGGQFTHRWALTSHSYFWSLISSIKRDDEMSLYSKLPATAVHSNRRRRMAEQSKQPTRISVTVIAANPRSYCYLDGRRFINNKLQYPPENEISECPGYNQWEWGLEDGGRLPTPYRDRALESVDWNTTKLILRYENRDVIYLSGEKDTDFLHGSCEDDNFQGKFRRERSERFFQSLKEIFGYQIHKRMVIPNVGHDHSLIFESDQGVEAIFGTKHDIPLDVK